jgi:hypothetical protein
MAYDLNLCQVYVPTKIKMNYYYYYYSYNLLQFYLTYFTLLEGLGKPYLPSCFVRESEMLLGTCWELIENTFRNFNIQKNPTHMKKRLGDV